MIDLHCWRSVGEEEEEEEEKTEAADHKAKTGLQEQPVRMCHLTSWTGQPCH